MNREIKFRAWDGKRITTNAIMFNNSTGLLEVPKTINDPKIELMQFTGLLDKNGKEIYDGDITNDKTIVVFENGAFRTTYDGDTQSGTLLSESRCRHIEIIGNIYEHKHLLG